MPTFDAWVDFCMRQLRLKFRDTFNAWVGNDKAGMIEKAEQLETDLKRFIEYLKGEGGS